MTAVAPAAARPRHSTPQYHEAARLLHAVRGTPQGRTSGRRLGWCRWTETPTSTTTTTISEQTRDGGSYHMVATLREYGPGVIRVESVNYTPRHGPKGGLAVQDPQVLAARVNADRQRRWRQRNRPRKDAKHPSQAVKLSDAQLEAKFMLPSSGFAALRLFQDALNNVPPRFGAPTKRLHGSIVTGGTNKK
jgi:hypothetical protein